DLFLGEAHHIRKDLGRNDNYAIIIREDEVAGIDHDAAAQRRYVVGVHDASALGIDGPDSRGEYRKPQLFNLLDVTHEAVDDRAAGATGPRCSREEFSPWSVAGRFARRHHNHLAGKKAIDRFDFGFVW